MLCCAARCAALPGQPGRLWLIPWPGWADVQLVTSAFEWWWGGAGGKGCEGESHVCGTPRASLNSCNPLVACTLACPAPSSPCALRPKPPGPSISWSGEAPAATMAAPRTAQPPPTAAPRPTPSRARPGTLAAWRRVATRWARCRKWAQGGRHALGEQRAPGLTWEMLGLENAWVARNMQVAGELSTGGAVAAAVARMLLLKEFLKSIAPSTRANDILLKGLDLGRRSHTALVNARCERLDMVARQALPLTSK